MSPNHGDHGRGQVCDRDSRGRRGRSLQASSDGQCQGMDKNGWSWSDHIDHEIAQSRGSRVQSRVEHGVVRQCNNVSRVGRQQHEGRHVQNDVGLSTVVVGRSVNAHMHAW